VNISSDAELSIRLQSGDVVDTVMRDVTSAMMRDAVPWRTFRMRYGQPHYSGTYWCATVDDHVIHESRLELSRLMVADFDPSVHHIVAQPFMMRTRIGGRIRRHVPDYYLGTDDGFVVVDVKPRDRLDDPKVAATFAWTREIAEAAGWTFEVACEQPRPYIDNVRFLAGYRRSRYVSGPALDELRSKNLDGLTVDEVLSSTSGPRPLVKATLLHMLWTHEVMADLSERLWSQTLIAVPSRIAGTAA
jgi:hypothetical protein